MRADIFAPEDEREAAARDADRRGRKVLDEISPRGRRPLDHHVVLRNVVREYRSALEARDPAPRRAVAATLNYTPAYVGKLLVEARKRRMLGAAAPGRAGEVVKRKRQASMTAES
jgi:hypothetical protein